MIDIRFFVEGKDDVRFINNILFPYLLNIMSVKVFPITYSQKRNTDVNKLIKTCISKKQNYFLLGDFDSSNKCITLKKSDLIEKFNNLDDDVIFIVKDEIESWFISGVDVNLDQFKEFKIPDDTENITKEDFDDMLDKSHFELRIDLLLEISKNYDFDLAKKRNKSFKYFIEKIESKLLNFE